MALLLDTSGVLAAIDASEPDHAIASDALKRAQPPLLLSPFVLAEIDYLLSERRGATAEAAFLGEVGRGAYQLEAFGGDDVQAALEIIVKYADIGVGLSDASIVILAERHGTTDVLTFDERHFRSLRTSSGGKFSLLPARSGRPRGPTSP